MEFHLVESKRLTKIERKTSLKTVDDPAIFVSVFEREGQTSYRKVLQ